MNCRGGSVCRGQYDSQLIFIRDGKVEGHRFFSIQYQVRNKDSFFNKTVIVHLYTSCGKRNVTYYT